MPSNADDDGEAGDRAVGHAEEEIPPIDRERAEEPLPPRIDREREVARLVGLIADPAPLLEEDCPICMIPLPVNATGTGGALMSCCAKTICGGCTNESRKSYAARGEAEWPCAFCRRRPAADANEARERLNRLVERGNADAISLDAFYHERGIVSCAKNEGRATELHQRAAALGHKRSMYNIGNHYMKRSLAENMDGNLHIAMHWYKKAAEKGDVFAYFALGKLYETMYDDNELGLLYFGVAYAAGMITPYVELGKFRTGYLEGLISKEIFATLLRSHHLSVKAMTSDAREEAIRAVQGGVLFDTSTLAPPLKKEECIASLLKELNINS